MFRLALLITSFAAAENSLISEAHLIFFQRAMTGLGKAQTHFGNYRHPIANISMLLPQSATIRHTEATRPLGHIAVISKTFMELNLRPNLTSFCSPRIIDLTA